MKRPHKQVVHRPRPDAGQCQQRLRVQLGVFIGSHANRAVAKRAGKQANGCARRPMTPSCPNRSGTSSPRNAAAGGNTQERRGREHRTGRRTHRLHGLRAYSPPSPLSAVPRWRAPTSQTARSCTADARLRVDSAHRRVRGNPRAPRRDGSGIAIGVEQKTRAARKVVGMSLQRRRNRKHDLACDGIVFDRYPPHVAADSARASVTSRVIDHLDALDGTKPQEIDQQVVTIRPLVSEYAT